ncbi:hypothetical protein [Nocardioides marmorisolisilvae]|uniref:Lipoprotein n=1 Tax=Nocardioides marmorisolisilvae TaxID=1542737 RepID=A0A3N0DUJ3_9ACTN|nr:hypothetical protein [Nocardioides marmorisolisilvae]RNL79268.1 hypothetical protein EFL95_09665 [Nocardioides marmorisolisilvae]
MKKIPVMVAAALLGSSLVSGCGGSSGYCDTVKADAQTLTDFTSPAVQPDFAKIPAFLKDAKDLESKSPKEVKEDWSVITSTLQSLSDGLADVGMTYAQFATFLSTGTLPDGVTQAQTAGLALKYQQLGADIVTKAANEITQHAAHSCDVDLTRKG